LILILALVACSGADKMAGFPEREARAHATAVALDACAVREGSLVLEVESALVREYPSIVADPLDEKKQPLLLLWVLDPSGGPGADVIAPVVAPEQYRAGDPIGHFKGLKLLERPLRLMRGRRIDVRLAENDRTAEPEWNRVASRIGHDVAGVAGLPGSATAAWDVALRLLRDLDRDDLILLWSVSADSVIRSVTPLSDHHAVRYRLETARRTGNQPSAELTLLFYLEPEPGCP
jgi:hypothetical protein